MIALLDNTVMSNFAATGRLDLLRAALAGGLATSEQAFDELQAGVRLAGYPILTGPGSRYGLWRMRNFLTIIGF